MKKYMTKWVVSFDPNKPPTWANCTHTLVGLVRPTNMNGTVNYERMMVADEAWVRQNMGNIDLADMELAEIYTPQLKGEEEE